MKTQKTLHFLAVSGSLRASSSNTRLLRAAIALAPENVSIVLCDLIGELPHFNPDNDKQTPPAIVEVWRQQLRDCDALLICSPEYAHGVPGTLKNALDWIVGSGELMHKPVALLNASLMSTHAHESLSETLRVMMARLDAQTSVRIALKNNTLDENDIIALPEIAQPLRAVLDALSHLAHETSSN